VDAEGGHGLGERAGQAREGARRMRVQSTPQVIDCGGRPSTDS
jgi:hypothetical protein